MTEQIVSIIRTMDDAERAAASMVASGFFQDSKQASQAVVKILAGQELGFGPFASMTGVNIIQNKPVLAANLMAAAVKRQGKYNYRIVEANDKKCELAWFENGTEVGRSTFTWSDAERANLVTKDNWKKYPSDMLFARALSRGQKRYAPDIFNGATVYTPDELGATVDEEGSAIIPPAGEVVDAVAADPRPEPDPLRYPPDILKQTLTDYAHSIRQSIADGKRHGCTETERKVLAAALGKVPSFDQNTVRYETCEYLTGTASTKSMPGEFILALLDWLKVKSFNDEPLAMSKREAVKAHEAALLVKGQLPLA